MKHKCDICRQFKDETAMAHVSWVSRVCVSCDMIGVSLFDEHMTLVNDDDAVFVEDFLKGKSMSEAFHDR